MNPATRSFLRAAAEGDANLIRALLAQGTDVNSRNAAGQSALMLASAFGHLAVVKILLAAGAERDLQDDLGFNALDWSVNYNSIGELITAPQNEPQPAEVTATPPVVPPPQSPIVKTEEPKANQPVRRGLGGLAGAILRDKAAQVTENEPPAVLPTVTTNNERVEVKTPEPVSVPINVPVDLTPPSKGEDAVITSGIDSEPAPIVEPQPDSLVAVDPVPAISSLFKPRKKILTPLPEDDIPDLPPSFETPAAVTAPPADDGTWSGRETDDTASPGTRPVAAARILSVDESTERPVASKVKVDVPSFKPIHHSTPRPILWLLIILFVAIGAYGGYRLSNYLFDKQNKEAPKETSVQQTQPLAAPIKLGPVVGGNLSGLEVLVPDASYPPSSKIEYGSVTVRVQVDQKGRVTSARATDGDKSLRAAAEEAARRAAFSPEKLLDKGRFVVGTITYNFLAPQAAAAANSPVAPAPTAQPTSTPSVPSETEGAPKVGGPLAGTELNVPAPEYPSAARRDRLQGTVTLVIRVNNSGKVVSWRTLEGDQRLRAAAIRAARDARFNSAKLPKNDVVGTITYTFRP